MSQTQQDMIDKFAAQFGVTKVQAAEMIGFTLDAMHDGAMANDRATFRGHIFKKKIYAARGGINPQTQQRLVIPEKTVVVYKNTGR